MIEASIRQPKPIRPPGPDDPEHASGTWVRLMALALGMMVSLATQAMGQTTVTFDSFGLGNAFRPGGPVAARVLISSDLDEAVPAIVEWEIANPDGDRQLNTRPIELPARGGTAATWLIADLPSRSDAMSVAAEPWSVRVFEFREGQRVREIASAKLAPSICGARPIDQSAGLAVVIGPNDAGLQGYSSLAGRGGRPGLNEYLEIVTGVEPPDLPDMWAGIEPAELIVWTADVPRFQPGTLGTRLTVEGALRSWLERGGHLVIALPRTGDPWRLERGDGVLDDLLAGISPITDTTYPLSQALPALADTPGLRDPDRTITLHRFEIADLPPEWRPLAGFHPAPPPFDLSSVEIPEDTPPAVAERLVRAAREQAARPAPVIHAIRRDVGHGTLDILGIDPSDPDIRVQQPKGLPATWVFWNPILGRRTFTPTASLVDALAQKRELAQAKTIETLGDRRLISEEIAQQGSGRRGLLLAVVTFGGYWLLAGPLGFSLLSRLNRRRQAWLAFVATSLLAAVLGWLVGELAVANDTPIRHLTVLRHRYAPEDSSNDTPLDRATCWFSTQLPGYGAVDVSVGEDAGQTSARGGLDLLRHFSPPPNGFESGFLDAARYDVDSRRRNRIPAPARATSAEFVADWLGRPNPISDAWSSTIKVDASDPVRLSMIERDQVEVSGTLVNGTGLDLEQIIVILISPVRAGPLPLDQRGLPGIPGTDARLTAQMPNLGAMVAVALERWAPGERLPLGGTDGVFGEMRRLPRFGRTALGEELNDRFEPLLDISQAFRPNLTFNERIRDLQALSLFQALPAPPIEQRSNAGRSEARFIRLLGRSLDLSQYLVEPGILVLATSVEAPCPVPVQLDGEPVQSRGTVLLQWIHPLPPDPNWLVPPRPEAFDDPISTPRAQHTLSAPQLNGVAAAWR